MYTDLMLISTDNINVHLLNLSKNKQKTMKDAKLEPLKTVSCYHVMLCGRQVFDPSTGHGEQDFNAPFPLVPTRINSTWFATIFRFFH